MKKNLLYVSKLDFQKNNLKLLRKNFKFNNCNKINDYSRKNKKKIEILLIPMDDYYNYNKLNEFSNLKIIASPTTGNVHIDLQYLKKNNIKFLNLSSKSKIIKEISATAEHTWALIFDLIRKYDYNHINFLNNNLNYINKYTVDFSFRNLSIGIVGLGRIGKKVYKIAKKFKMNVLFYDPHVSGNYSTKCKSLKELASKVNILSLHNKYDDKNYKMINEHILSNLKRPSYLINTARGELVDESAVLKLLKNKTLTGCALDTVSNEFKPSFKKNPRKNKLIEYSQNNSNLLITPKIGGAVVEAWEKTENYLINRILKSINE